MSPAVKLRRRNAKAAINQQYLSDSTYKYVRRQLPSDLEDMNTLVCYFLSILIFVCFVVGCCMFILCKNVLSSSKLYWL